MRQNIRPRRMMLQTIAPAIPTRKRAGFAVWLGYERRKSTESWHESGAEHYQASVPLEPSNDFSEAG